jgi:hypothetical protein
VAVVTNVFDVTKKDILHGIFIILFEINIIFSNCPNMSGDGGGHRGGGGGRDGGGRGG